MRLGSDSRRRCCSWLRAGRRCCLARLLFVLRCEQSQSLFRFFILRERKATAWCGSWRRMRHREREAGDSDKRKRMRRLCLVRARLAGPLKASNGCWSQVAESSHLSACREDASQQQEQTALHRSIDRSLGSGWNRSAGEEQCRMAASCRCVGMRSTLAVGSREAHQQLCCSCSRVGSFSLAWQQQLVHFDAIQRMKRA